MTQEGFKRKLTAILSADVEGYSRLMGDDEETTVRTLTSYREVLSTLIQQHNGKVLDSPGDNLLAEFVSVVDAVQCAVAVQKEIKARNDQLPENRRMQFRIGINLGDVIQEEERIYGDGVNIAARLEGLANPGGICISKTAFDQIESKLPYGYEFLGDQAVKNIAKPVSAYRVLMEPRVTVAGEPEAEKPSLVSRKAILVGAIAVVVVTVAVGIWQFYMRSPSVEPASVENMAFSLPDKPSIAVLPFDNLSGNPEDEFIADGISEGIITALSKTPKMFVIARNSTFTYKGKAVKIQKVAEDLSVRYVLEGSLQKSEDQLRINAQLIDAITGNHLWAEKYDRNMKDIFALQDDIAMKIITALQVKLSEGEHANIVARGTENLEAYLKVLQAEQQWQRGNKEGDAIAQKLAKEAISLDPNFSAAYGLLSRTQFREVLFRTTKDPKMTMELSIENSKKAIALDPSSADAQSYLGWLYTMMRQHEKGIAAGERGLALNPNSSRAYSNLGLSLVSAGRPDEAIKLYKKAIRLSPIPSANILFCQCFAYRDAGRYEEGIAAAKKAIQAEPDSLFAHMCLASSYVLLGRIDEAKAEAAEMLRINPKYKIGKRSYYKNPADTERINEALRKAGLPE